MPRQARDKHRKAHFQSRFCRNGHATYPLRCIGWGVVPCRRPADALWELCRCHGAQPGQLPLHGLASLHNRRPSLADSATEDHPSRGRDALLPRGQHTGAAETETPFCAPFATGVLIETMNDASFAKTGSGQNASKTQTEKGGWWFSHCQVLVSCGGLSLLLTPEVRKRVFLRCRFILKMPSFYQARLGTNIDGENSQKEWRFCRATWHSVSVRSSWSRLPRRYCRESGSPSAHRSTVCGKRRVFFVLLRHSLSCGNHSRSFAKTGSEQNHRNTQLRWCLSQAAPPLSALRRTLRRPAALKRCRLHLRTFR